MPPGADGLARLDSPPIERRLFVPAMHAAETIYQVARETPDATALVYDLEAISYRRFHQMLTRVRRTFAGRRLSAGAVAVVWIDNLLAAWLADLALRLLGLTTVAVRSDSELRLFADLDVAAIVTFAEEPGKLIEPAVLPAAQRIAIERSNWSGQASDGELEPPPDGAAGGHILLTSGTTGRYKMVLIDEAFEAARRAEVEEIFVSEGLSTHEALAPVDGRGPTANILFLGLWTSVGYGVPIRAWSRRGTVILHQRHDFAASLAVPGISYLGAPPAILAHLMSAPEGVVRRNDALQVVTFGGPLPLALAELVRKRLTNRIATALGSTESGPWAVTPVETGEDLRWHRIHPQRVVQVVDEDHQPLPSGQLGQVRVLQNNGISGYLNDPETTRLFFRDGWFYPGDLGVMDDKGRLRLLGRVTDVINLRGDKLPAEPVETALQRALGVSAVCALSEQGSDAAEQLHIVLETASPIDAATLRHAAEAHLRGFTDIHFHFVDALPRNHMGKIERFKLKQQLTERRLQRA